MNGLLIALSLYGLIFLTAELLFYLRIKPFYSRKFIHILGSFVTASLPVWFTRVETIAIGVGFTLLLLVNHRFNYLKSVQQDSRSNFGSVFFPLGLTIAAIIAWEYFTVITLVVGVADGLAGICGRLSAKSDEKKTILGSCVFFACTTLIFIYCKPIEVKPIILGGIILITTISERISDKGWDNLAVPVALGVMLMTARVYGFFITEMEQNLIH